MGKVEIQPTAELDARGLKCPIPIIKAKKKLDELKEGEILAIIADDPGAKRDFPAFCLQTGHELLCSAEEEGAFKFYIKKK